MENGLIRQDRATVWGVDIFPWLGCPWFRDCLKVVLNFIRWAEAGTAGLQA